MDSDTVDARAQANFGIQPEGQDTASKSAEAQIGEFMARVMAAQGGA
jgi:hypothetical protein